MESPSEVLTALHLLLGVEKISPAPRDSFSTTRKCIYGGWGKRGGFILWG